MNADRVEFQSLPLYALFRIEGQTREWQRIGQNTARGGSGLVTSTFPLTMLVQRVDNWNITPLK